MLRVSPDRLTLAGSFGEVLRFGNDTLRTMESDAAVVDFTPQGQWVGASQSASGDLVKGMFGSYGPLSINRAGENLIAVHFPSEIAVGAATVRTRGASDLLLVRTDAAGRVIWH
ncbi:MAG: hypothetical protein H7330_01715 [Hymenobacteraceae bacterium]|nr:hypothetical protein [Hymenobacteraceae bacterium]